MIRIRSGQDFFAGIMFLAFGALGAWVAAGYPFGTATRMGPGYLPVVLSWCMIVMGTIITARGLTLDGPAVARVKLRPLLFVLGAVLAYEYAIEHLGLALSVFLVSVLSAAANEKFRLVEAVILGVGLAVFCVLVFIHGLELPLSVWPPR